MKLNYEKLVSSFGFNFNLRRYNKDASGNIVSLEATYDPDSLGTKPPKAGGLLLGWLIPFPGSRNA